MFASGVLRRPFWWLTLASFGGTFALLAACGTVNTASSERQCLARAMYFESVRSSDDGMLAVGTVVMNRRASGKYPKTVCGVVGQHNQFAPGVLSKPMTEKKSRERAERVAGQVLAGKRHRGVGNAMFFHTAGRTYRFENMHYVAIEGGNAFYERRPTQSRYLPRTLVAQAGPRDSVSASGWGRTTIPTVGTFKRQDKPRPIAVAAATPPPPTPLSIEEIIIASNGW
jgi:spore germination cell wall hydrolase CwlJ-like protein